MLKAEMSARLSQSARTQDDHNLELVHEQFYGEGLAAHLAETGCYPPSEHALAPVNSHGSFNYNHFREFEGKIDSRGIVFRLETTARSKSPIILINAFYKCGVLEGEVIAPDGTYYPMDVENMKTHYGDWVLMGANVRNVRAGSDANDLAAGLWQFRLRSTSPRQVSARVRLNVNSGFFAGTSKYLVA
jgi:hypothetical protein